MLTPTPVSSHFAPNSTHLLVILLLIITTILLLGSLGLLAANTSWASTTEWRGQSEVDVLLGVEADHEGRDVDDLLADAVMMVSTWVQCARSLRILTGCGAGG